MYNHPLPSNLTAQDQKQWCKAVGSLNSLGLENLLALAFNILDSLDPGIRGQLA